MRQYFFYRRESLKTTWTFRLLVIAGTVLLLVLTRGWWEPSIAASLVCGEEAVTSDAILIENLEPEYLLFERSTQLLREGLASRVFVTVPASWNSPQPNLVTVEVVRVNARVAQLPAPEIITVQPVEPISLSVAQQVRDYFVAQNIRSVLIVSTGFRSRRTTELHRKVFGDAGIRSSCVPVVDPRSIVGWARTWHGVQGVALEFIKLQYYRFYVMPFRYHRDETST